MRPPAYLSLGKLGHGFPMRSPFTKIYVHTKILNVSTKDLIECMFVLFCLSHIENDRKFRTIRYFKMNTPTADRFMML